MSAPPPPYEPAPPLPAGPPPQMPLPPQAFNYQPLDGRLKAVKIVFFIIAGISVLAAASDLLEVLLLNQIIAGDPVSDTRINANDARQALFGLLQTAGLVTGAVVFIMWLHRAYQNTDAVAPGTRRYGHGWAIGGWFVPFMNLWRPKQVVNDVWNAGGDRAEPGWQLGTWWSFWILSNFVANAAGRAAFSGDTPEEIRSSSLVLLGADLLDAVAALLAVAAATALTRRLDARAAQGPPEPVPAPSWEDEHEPVEMGKRPPPGPLGSGRY